jgi:hypothetical protein
VTNLPVPVLPTEVPGNYMTSSLINTIGVSGLGFSLAVPVASLYQITSQSITNTTATAVNMDGENSDTYGGHSVTTNTSRYVAQVPGYYFCVATVLYGNNTTGVRIAYVYKNGALIDGSFGSTPGGNLYASATALAVPYLNGSSDYVEAWTYQTSGSNISTSSGSGQASSLTVYWLHQ